jgi:hypothetical protein
MNAWPKTQRTCTMVRSDKMPCRSGKSCWRKSRSKSKNTVSEMRIEPTCIFLMMIDELLIQHASLRTQPDVLERNRNIIENWLYNSQNAILTPETKYIYQAHDLMQLVPKPTIPLRRFLEASKAIYLLLKPWAKKTHAPAHSHRARYDINILQVG